MKDGNALEVRDLRFGGRGPYTFSIEGGRCLGLRGESGAGKSLLLRAIADLDPHLGVVRLGSLPAESMPAPAWRRQVGLLPADSAWWHDRVDGNFTDFASLSSQRLAALGFQGGVGQWQVRRLSTGERQRLAILRLLEQEPRCLLLDEPTASLDQDMVRQVEDLLMEYRRSRRVSMLWVSHDLEQLERVADTCLFMDRGGRLLTGMDGLSCGMDPVELTVPGVQP